MTKEATIKEITKEDKNYIYVKITNQKDFSRTNEVELISRKEKDSVVALVEMARETIRKLK